MARLATRYTAVAALLALTIGVAGCSSDGGGSASDGTDGADGEATTTEATVTGEGGTLSVLAYNVAGLPVEVSQVRPDLNLPLISPKLADFDVVLTQEDFDWWMPGGLVEQNDLDFVNYHTRLRAETGHRFASEAHPGADAVELAEGRVPPEVGDGLGVLSNFPIEGNERIPWTDCFGSIDPSDGGAADCLSMKGFSRTELTLADGVVVDLYNLHAEAGGTDADQTLQVDDFEQLADYIATHSEGRAIILGGDTNLHTDPPGTDGHEDSADGADLEIWNGFLAAAGLTDACEATDCDDTTRIDKIAFRSGDGVDLEALEYGFLDEDFVDDAGEPLSDHEPLNVVFGWKPAA